MSRRKEERVIHRLPGIQNGVLDFPALVCVRVPTLGVSIASLDNHRQKFTEAKKLIWNEARLIRQVRELELDDHGLQIGKCRGIAVHSNFEAKLRRGGSICL